MTRASAFALLAPLLVGLAGCVYIPARLKAEFRPAAVQTDNHFRKSPPASAVADGTNGAQADANADVR